MNILSLNHLMEILKDPHHTSELNMKRLKEVCKEKDPVPTMELIDSEVGDVVGQSSSGSRLRNLRQVTNAKRKLKLDSGCKSELAETMEKCKTGLGPSGVSFVRCVEAAPEPMCILATDRQIHEMVHNCTDTSAFVPIGVDPTFKLGKFYVTPIVFPLRMLVSKETGKSPVYLGPLLIHQSQKFTAYRYFASQLVGLDSRLKDIRAIGTDGEAALYDALKSVFPSAVHLRCFIHFKRNIEAKLQSLHLPANIVRDILRDIFGLSLDTEQQLGLVDVQNEIKFREKLEIVKPRWNKLECDHKLTEQGKFVEPQFHEWFVKEKADTMIQCMINDVRVKAGMGSDPDHFYTNMCESMNKTLKQRTDFKPNDAGPFIDKMFELVEAQEKLLRKAVIRSDRWRFREEYMHLEVDQDKWFTMNEKSQKRHMGKVYSAVLAIDGSNPKETHLECGSNSSDLTSAIKLAVGYGELVDNYRIATSTLEDIWQKAGQLVTTPGFITLVPGQAADSSNRMVGSSSGGEPHYIVRKNSGQYICNGLCPRFGAYKICQHAVAAAQDSGELSSFCRWWKSQHNNGPNLDSLAMSGLPKGVAGQMGGISKRGRRGRRRGTNAPLQVTDRTTTAPDLPHGTASNQLYCPYPAYQGSPTSSSNSYMLQSMQGSSRDSPYSSHAGAYLQGSYPPYIPSTSYSPHGIQPYSLKMLTKQIRVCSGCRLGYSNEIRVPEPPYNMCVSHEEPFEVRSQQAFTTKTIVHYHANPDCIWKKNPNFVPASLKIPPTVLPNLDESNKTYFIQFFGVYV